MNAGSVRGAEKTAAATGPGRADAVDLLPFPVPDRIPTAFKARG
ncbi:hypothetical protein OG985_41785 [Streptomyces sp. NBC_00289]